MELLAKEQKVAEIEAEIGDQKDRLSDRKPSPPPSTEEPIETVRRLYTADYISKYSDDHTSYRQFKGNNDLNPEAENPSLYSTTNYVKHTSISKHWKLTAQPNCNRVLSTNRISE